MFGGRRRRKARDKAAKFKGDKERFEQEKDQKRHLQSEIYIKADYEAALLQEESMTPDSLSVKSLVNLDRGSRRPLIINGQMLTTTIHKL